jgi:Fic family protein
VQFGSRHFVERLRQMLRCQIETVAGRTIPNHLGKHRAIRNGNAASVRLEPGLADHVVSESKVKRDVGAASRMALCEQTKSLAERQGRLIGRMEALGFQLREEAVLDTLTQDVLKSSEIEGEILDIDQVRSSIARRLGLVIGALTPSDRQVEGVVEMMLDATRSEKSPKRFYSMSAQIRLERNDYYDILERTQKGTLDVTAWMQWFLGCLNRAFDEAEITLATVLRKARFWETHAGESLNDRQRKVLNRLLDGFEGKLTSSKWTKLAKCSQDTASRDINDLLKREILVKDAAGGRSTSYSLNVGEVAVVIALGQHQDRQHVRGN